MEHVTALLGDRNQQVATLTSEMAQPGSDTNAVDVLVQGIMHDTSAFPTFSTVGADIFVSAAATGAVVDTAPSGSGDTVQKIGVALHADMIYFNFNTTEVLLA